MRNEGDGGRGERMGSRTGVWRGGGGAWGMGELVRPASSAAAVLERE